MNDPAVGPTHPVLEVERPLRGDAGFRLRDDPVSILRMEGPNPSVWIVHPLLRLKSEDRLALRAYVPQLERADEVGDVRHRRNLLDERLELACRGVRYR